MKTPILLSLLISVSAAAHAQSVFEQETMGRCAIQTFKKPNHGGLGEIAHTTIIPFKFPGTQDFEQTIHNSKTIRRYGVGKVELVQTIDMMSAQGQVIKNVPIKISLEVETVKGNPDRKVLLFSVNEILNIFTGKVERNLSASPRENHVVDSFLYPEFAITAKDVDRLPVGAVIQTGIICPLFTKDTPVE
jgi:hypothetical protein